MVSFWVLHGIFRGIRHGAPHGGNPWNNRPPCGVCRGVQYPMKFVGIFRRHATVATSRGVQPTHSPAKYQVGAKNGRTCNDVSYCRAVVLEVQ